YHFIAHAKFAKKHKVVESPYPIGSKVMIKNVNRQNKLDERYEGPYLIHNVTDSGSYTLMDKTGALLGRDIPTHQIVYIAAANPKPTSVDKFCKEHYEIQAVLDHKGSPGNYLNKVHGRALIIQSNILGSLLRTSILPSILNYIGVEEGGAKATGKRRSAPKTVNWRKAAARKEKRSKQQTKRS
ncbi:hypothetical protein, partial, partial [Parasitella parasitica]